MARRPPPPTRMPPAPKNPLGHPRGERGTKEEQIAEEERLRRTNGGVLPPHEVVAMNGARKSYEAEIKSVDASLKANVELHRVDIQGRWATTTRPLPPPPSPPASSSPSLSMPKPNEKVLVRRARFRENSESLVPVSQVRTQLSPPEMTQVRDGLKEFPSEL
jgi:hypothetical protein